ncbi:MAG: hypothetical protein K8T26_11900 [Lentisphaerae bacterium]|nr:hypothetical protein [Lentisphaerota bacterium]
MTIQHVLRMATLAAALGALSAPAADMLTLADGQTVTGTFQGYRSGQFEMQSDTAKPVKYPQLRVTALTLSPPVAVQVHRRGGKNLNGVQLTGYQKPTFAFATDTGDLQIPGVQVASIEAMPDMQRDMQHVAESARTAQAAVPHDETFRLAIHTGTVTVIQFHMDTVMSSVRQGGYVQSRCDDSRGKLRFERVDLTGWDDPVAQRYHIASVPQFWFFDREGNLRTKLTDRFTTDDIDAAFAAMRP